MTRTMKRFYDNISRLFIVVLIATIFSFASFLLSTNNATAADQKIFGIRVIIPDSPGNVVTIQWHTTFNSSTRVEYGSIPGSYINSKEKPGAFEDFHGVIFRVDYNKTYYYRIVATDLEGVTTYSEEQSFTTLKKEINIEKIEVRDITSSSALINITLSKEGYAIIQFGVSPDNLLAEINSTSANQTESRTRQAILEGLKPESAYYFKVIAKTPAGVEGVQEAISIAQSFKTTKTSPQPPPEYLSSFNSCALSTTIRNTTTLQIKTPFTKDSETDKYLQNVYDAYTKEWGRAPRCDELQFHLDHSTLLERLVEWLKGKVITERFGCNISTVFGGDSTILVKEPLTLGSDTNKYLEAVVNAYTSIWGRDPRCDELQFHLDHSTSLTRLQSWLEENKPGAKTEERNEIVFTETDGKVVLKDASQTLRFGESDIITFSGKTIPNVFVVLTISSEPILETILSDDKGSWSYTPPGPFEAGDHTIKIAVSDKDGKKISESEVISFKIVSFAQQPTALTRPARSLWIAGIIGLFLVIFSAALFITMSRLKSK